MLLRDGHRGHKHWLQSAGLMTVLALGGCGVIAVSARAASSTYREAVGLPTLTVIGSIDGMSTAAMRRLIAAGLSDAMTAGCSTSSSGPNDTYKMSWHFNAYLPKTQPPTAVAELYHNGQLVRRVSSRIYAPAGVRAATSIAGFGKISRAVLGCVPKA